MDFLGGLVDSMFQGGQNESHPAEIAARGDRWASTCGAGSKKRASGSSYKEYLLASESDVFIKADLEQIELDVLNGRTDPDSWTTAGMKEMLENDGLTLEAWRQALHNVLVSLARRNHSPGYCQGMNYIAAFFLAHVAEETAFWMMCVLVEDMRGVDFYAKPPASMNGFMVEMKVVTAVLGELMPELVNNLGGAIELQMLVEVVSPKLLIPMFVDEMSLGSLCFVFEQLQCTEYGPDCCGIYALVTLFQVAYDQHGADGASLNHQQVLATCRQITPEQLEQGFQKLLTDLLPWARILELRGQAKAELAEQWISGTRGLRQLSRATHFSQKELAAMQLVFKEKCGEGKLGLSRDQFAEVVAGLPRPLPKEYMEHMYRSLDEDGNEQLDFREVNASTTHPCHRAHNSYNERDSLTVWLYDVDNSGMLEPPEISAMASALSRSPGHAHLEGGVDFAKKILMMDVNSDGRVSFSELYSGVSADMEMQMLLGVGPTEEEAAEESEDGLCCICHAEQALRQATKTEQPTPAAPGSVVKAAQRATTKYVRLLVCMVGGMHPGVKKLFLQVEHPLGQQRTGVTSGVPVGNKLKFEWNQCWGSAAQLTCDLCRHSTFLSRSCTWCHNQVKFVLRECPSQREVASGEVDIAELLNESTSRAEATIELQRYGMLERLTRHSINAVQGNGAEPEGANPSLQVMLATHECSALHKDFVPLTFTFHSMAVDFDKDYVAAAQGKSELPAELRLELARAGRSVSTASVPLDGKTELSWPQDNAMQVALHLFKSESFELDGTFAQKNVLLRLKDGVAGGTLGAARLDLSTVFAQSVSQVEVALVLHKLDQTQQGTEQQTASSSWSFFKTGWAEMCTSLGVGKTIGQLRCVIDKQNQDQGMMAAALEAPNVEAWSPKHSCGDGHSH